MLYKGSAPAPLFHSPEISDTDTLWIKQDEKIIIRMRDVVDRGSWGGRQDESDATVEYPKRPLTQSQMLPPIAGELSKMSSLSKSMSSLDKSMSEWCKTGNGCWTNFERFGPLKGGPPNDNCGRWRQMNSFR